MKILVSACLLGVACRYDGKTKDNPQVVQLAKTHTLIPFCPEVYGGLSTPRDPSEIRNGAVYTKNGDNVTAQFEKGAQEAVKLARTLGCTCALLQDRSPSCGVGLIHDGSFTDALVVGDGLAARALMDAGLRVLPASRATELEGCPCPKKCHRHGDCAACREHHDGRKKPPFCERT